MHRRFRIIALITAVALLASLTAYTAPAFAGLSDIGDHWARNEITTLYSAGMIGGYPDGKFRPEQPITRAEFVTLLNRVAGLGIINYSGSFSDVRADDWYAGEVATAVANDYVHGYEDGTFAPDASITRFEVAVLLQRAADARNQSEGYSGLSDYSSTPGWAVAAVSACLRAGYIHGYDDGKFHGERNLTRAEAAVLLFRTRDALVKHLTEPLGGPAVKLTPIVPPSATNGVATPVGLTLLNSGGPVSEKVDLDVTIWDMAGSSADPKDAVVQYKSPGDTQYRTLTLHQDTEDTNVLVGSVGGDAGFTLGGGFDFTYPLLISFRTGGQHRLRFLVRGAKSGLTYGDPVIGDIVSCEITNTLLGLPKTAQVGTVLPVTFDLKTSSAGNGHGPDMAVQIVVSGLQKIDAGDVKAEWLRDPLSNYWEPMESGVDAATGQLYLGAANSLSTSVSFGSGQHVQVLMRLTFTRPDTYSLEACAWDLGVHPALRTPFLGTPFRTQIVIPQPPPPPAPKVTLSFGGIGQKANALSATADTPVNVDVVVSNSGGAVPEPCSIKLKVAAASGTVSQFPIDSYTASWELSPLPMATGDDGSMIGVTPLTTAATAAGAWSQQSLRMTPGIGRYTLSADLVGDQTGKSYASATISLTATEITLTMTGSDPMHPSATNYSVTLENRAAAALPEPVWIEVRYANSAYGYGPMKTDDVALGYYVNGNSAVTTMASVVIDSTGTWVGTLGGTKGYLLAANGRVDFLLIPMLRVAGQMTVSVRVIGVSGVVYGAPVVRWFTVQP